MLEEHRLLPILDMLANRAREFTHVSKRVLDVESALQARDGEPPDEWQVICIISAFINYIAERNRCRYGHYAFDIDPKNNDVKKKDAECTLDRMELFWGRAEDVWSELTEEQQEERQQLLNEFLENDNKIKEHLQDQPDVYAVGVPQEQHRDWMIRLRLLGDEERSIIKRWKTLVEKQRVQSEEKEDTISQDAERESQDRA